MKVVPGMYRKYHGLGNDYLIPMCREEATPEKINSGRVRLLCDTHYGLGSDGILYGPYMPDSEFYKQLGQPEALCAFRILNPDGSEAEKSGNGVRIFARYLFDCGIVKQDEPFVLATLGGPVRCRIIDPDKAIQAEMGHVSFDSAEIPVNGPHRITLHETLELDGETVHFAAATVGNPHCVVVLDENAPKPDKALACRLGPKLESHSLFPNRTNVQFIQRISPHRIRVEIYERGAGYTLASGSSATACAAVAVKLGLCESPVIALMPGGALEISLDDDFNATLVGPVTRVYDALLFQNE